MKQDEKSSALTDTSLFRSLSSVAPQNCPWRQLRLHYTNLLLKEKTLQYRELKSLKTDEADKRASQIKASMPNITVSVRCKGGRRNEHIEALTGVILVDFDHVPQPQLELAFERLKCDPHVLLAAHTIGGEGLRALFRVDGYSVRNFTRAFLFVNRYAEQLVHLPFDPACKNITRVSIVNYDPEVYFNENAQPLKFVEDESLQEDDLQPPGSEGPVRPTPSAEATVEAAAETPDGTTADASSAVNKTDDKEQPSSDKSKPSSDKSKTSSDKKPSSDNKTSSAKKSSKKKQPVSLDTMVRNAQILARRKDFKAQPHQYNAFINCCVYLLASWGAKSHDVLDWALARFPEHEAANTRSTVQSIYAKKPQQEEMPTFGNEVKDMEYWIDDYYRVRRNVIKGVVEISPLGSGRWEDLSDCHENEIWRQMSFDGLRFKPQDVHTLLTSNYPPSFHPLKAYLETLPVWDGQTDYLQELAMRVTVEEDQEMFCRIFKKWMVAMLACVLRPRVANEIVLVLLGEQGIRKTTFFEYLLPYALREYYLSKVNTDGNSKDDLLELTQLMLINYEEMGVFNVLGMSRLKATASKKETNERPAYGRNHERRKRIASLCGTGNERALLDVDTDGRRMVMFWAQSIVDPRLEPINYEGVYSQAYALMQDEDFKFWLETDDIRALKKHNKLYMKPNLERELINTYYRVPGDVSTEFGTPNSCHWVTVGQILERIGHVRAEISSVRIGLAMIDLGFKARRCRGMKMYWVADRTPQEISLLHPDDEAPNDGTTVPF